MQPLKALLFLLLGSTIVLGYLSLKTEFEIMYSDSLLAAGSILACVTFLRLGSSRK
ncbi:MAG: hypothetical protein HKO75_08850 [Flavobacteriaceae bacterium]|nr:hypothetical protein [Muriicola sp.]NNL39954.1 hypothetical protein [Flavobacteriaceae bacterium]